MKKEKNDMLDDDVLESFDDEPKTEIDKALKRYEDILKDDFPTIPLLKWYSEEEVIEMIDKCIEENKNVIEMGYYEQDNDIKY